MNDTLYTPSPEDATPPPGLSELSYSTGTYAVVLQRLLRRLATQHGENSDLPVLQLNTQPRANWIVGLLESWAMVIDVLSFYQERIVNEGYLRTATEPRSIRELTSAVGYELRPGISASTYLAFIVRVGKGEPARRCILPQGLAVQSVPTQGQRVVSFPEANKPPAQAQLPQIFETSTTFEASSEWNMIKPLEVAARRDRTLPAGSNSLLLTGIKTGVQVDDPLLIVSEDSTADNQRGQWLFVSVETVEPNLQRGFTRITWKEAPGESPQNTELRNPTVYTFRQQAKLYNYARSAVYATSAASVDWSPVSIGLPGIAIHAFVTRKDGTMFVGTDSGVFRSINTGESWESVSIGLMRMKIYALTTSDDGRLFAGSNTGNLFVSADNGNTWQMVVSRSTTRRGLLALLPLPQSPPQALPRDIIRALASYREQNRSYLAAATATGVFVSADGGKSWHQPPADNSANSTPRVAAWAFAAKGEGQKPLVGMDTGVFPIGSPNWRRWLIPLALLILALSLLLFLAGAVAQIAAPVPAVGRVIFQYGFFEQLSFMLRQLPIPFSLLTSLANFFQPLLLLLLLLLAIASAVAFIIATRTNQKPHSAHPLPTAPVKALAFSDDGTLFVGSADGLFRSSDQGLNWTQLPNRPEGTIAVMAPGTQKALFIGTQEGRVYRSQDAGNAWEDFSRDLHLNSVLVLAASTNSLFAAGEPDNTDESGQWSRFQLAKKQLNLDKVYTTILPNTWVILAQGDQLACYAVSSVATSVNQDYKKSTSLTSLYVDNDTGLASFSRLATRVYVGSKELDLFDDEPIQGDSMTFDRFVPGLQAGQYLIVSGKRMRVRLPDAITRSATLHAVSGLQQHPLSSDSNFELLAAPTLQRQGGGEAKWLLRDRDGFVGTLSALSSSVTYELAEDSDETVSELVVLQSVSADSQSKVTFSAALQHIYDRSTVVVYGNVVQATHGQTVLNEVLGSVDQQQTYHRFQLKQKPLSYLSADAAENNAPAQLTVMVNQVPWHRVPSFDDLKQGERAYVVRQDDRENTQIIFGNGSAGTPPPTGQEHITASYRFGSGSVGNLPPNSLTLLRTRPPAIQSVTNPVSATGGVDPEAADEACTNAARHIQTMQRVVSLIDYEQFARAFPGIGKVEVKKLWQGRTHLLLMTVAGQEETWGEADSAAYQSLQDAIVAAVAPPAPIISILPYAPAYFQFEGRLLIAAEYALQYQDVVAEVLSELRDTFGFNLRQLGQGVAAAELILLIQQVRGIVAVEIERLYIRDQEPGFNAFLAAASGRLETGSPQPAQLLLFDADDDYERKLQVEIQQL
jgi:photosystem II stability/assembly factor-like uncharacterized protein